MANTSALFSRIKNWGATDVLTASDLNAEFNNILTNFTPAMMGSYSFNVAQMQIQTAPGGVGTENLAAALSGELERLRYQLAAIQGTTFWYQTPPATLTTLNSALGASSLLNRVSSGVTSSTGQPAFLIPDGTTNRVTLAATTPLVYSVAGSQFSISSSITIASLSTAGASSAATTCIVNDTSVTAGSTLLLGENGSSITIGTAGSGITTLQGKIAGFRNTNSGEYFIGRVASSTILMDCYRGYFQTGASSFALRQNITNGDTIQLMQLTWIYATTAGALTAVSTNPTYSGTAPSSPGTGDYWFDESVNFWKIYNGSIWIAANATLIGISIQDPTKTVGTRALDFFESFSSLNTVELYDSPNDTAFSARSRYTGSQISIYGTSIKNEKSYWGWNASGTGLIDSTALTSGNVYYFYLSNIGNTYVSSLAPYNRSGDLLGFYHPFSPYRCVGFGLCTTSGTSTFSDIESFYVAQPNAAVAQATTANSNLLVPSGVWGKESLIECNAAGGAFTQILPHPQNWKGQRLVYVKTDNSSNQVTVQSWGSVILTATGNTTFGNTSLSTLGATNGLVSGLPYLASGPGLPWGTTATWSSGGNATLSQNALLTATGSTITWAQVPVGAGILVGTATTVGQFSVTLNTIGESVELMSDGSNIICVSHSIPSQWLYAGVNTFAATTTSPGKGTTVIDQSWYQRSGRNANIRLVYSQSAAGTAGSGDYLIALAGLTADTNLIPTYTGSVGVFLNGIAAAASAALPSSGYIGGTGTLDALMSYLYSSTTFRTGGLNLGGPNHLPFASGTAPLSSTTVTFVMNIFGLPIQNWWV